jgi:hypothetical protein
MSKWTYEERLLIPVDGNSSISFFGHGGNLLAIGYTRVVIGQRGPYIEFDPHMLNWNEWIECGELNKKHHYYLEYRSIADNIKAYKQKITVDYADYLIGKIYISPFDLLTIDGVIIKPLSECCSNAKETEWIGD